MPRILSKKVNNKIFENQMKVKDVSKGVSKVNKRIAPKLSPKHLRSKKRKTQIEISQYTDSSSSSSLSSPSSSSLSSDSDNSRPSSHSWTPSTFTESSNSLSYDSDSSVTIISESRDKQLVKPYDGDINDYDDTTETDNDNSDADSGDSDDTECEIIDEVPNKTKENVRPLNVHLYKNGSIVAKCPTIPIVERKWVPNIIMPKVPSIVKQENDALLNAHVIEIDAQITRTKIMNHIIASSSSSSSQSECPDIECLPQNFRVSLICPITNKKLMVPARTKSCEHFTCFELNAYYMINKNKDQSKWKCPICQKDAPSVDLVTDGLIKAILNATNDSCKAVTFNNLGWTPEVTDGQSDKPMIEEIIID